MNVKFEMPVIREFSVDIEKLTRDVLFYTFLEDYLKVRKANKDLTDYETLSDINFIDWCIKQFKYCDFDYDMCLSHAGSILKESFWDSYPNDLYWTEAEQHLEKEVLKQLKRI